MGPVLVCRNRAKNYKEVLIDLVGWFGTYAHQNSMRCCKNTTVVYVYAPTPLTDFLLFPAPEEEYFFDIQIKKNLGTCRERIGLAVPRSKHHCLVGVGVYGQAFGSESTSLSYCHSRHYAVPYCTCTLQLNGCCAYKLLQLLPSTCPGSHASSQLPLVLYASSAHVVYQRWP